MLEIAIHNPRQHRQFRHSSGALMLARAADENTLWTTIERDNAANSDAILEIQRAADGIALVMAGCEAECHCGRNCPFTGNCRLPVPSNFSIGDTRFEIIETNDDSAAQLRPLQKLRGQHDTRRGNRPSGGGPSPPTLSRWFAALGTLNHWATSLQELFTQAAQCAVEAIGLDGAMVVRRRDDEWEIAASHLPHPELGIHCEISALDKLLDSPETLFHGAEETAAKFSNPQSAIPNPQSATALVLSPLRNSSGALVGAIYGYRSVRPGNARRGIRYLEAHWIELLAGAVSDAMSRLERQSQVDRRRVLLERTFANLSDSDRQILAGETREVTLLFADLREFTRLSESLEMDVVYELLGQVMDMLTAAVMDHDGLVIDYYGDGLAAMWNAPADQAEHAELACRAGLRMVESLPGLASDWADVLDAQLRLGVGIHTGLARVGNAGSRRRTKYGPRGPNVNLTSRVEAATKELGLPLIVTRATAGRLSNRMATHRVCRARLLGLEQPAELFGVQTAASDAHLASDWQLYDEALGHFERGDLQKAADILSTIDPGVAEVPAHFLADYIEREQKRKLNRRRADDQGASSGIVARVSRNRALPLSRHLQEQFVASLHFG